ncbi:hypothetical protein Sste5346_003551 [Sporothrix stenoceras]|uniref:BHLH domain-containing protein n=1 Tax=Sporothrix stenoceras TaxID=5173 RepID=A0ABR3ZCV5_9PEZI
MDGNSAADFDGTDDAEYMRNFQSIPKPAAATPNTFFANPVWGTETKLSTTTFTPGVYLHNRDTTYGYLDPHDTAGLTDWTKSVPGSLDPNNTSTMSMTPLHDQFLVTASPTEQQQSTWPIDTAGQPGACSSSSSSSSYMMATDATTIQPKILSGRVRMSAASHATSTVTGSVRQSRIAKPKSKPIGGSSSTRLPRTNSGNSASSSNSGHYLNTMDDKHLSVSSASSSASPPLEDSSSQRSRTASLFSSGGGITGLLTTGHGGNHNVTLRTASRKPKPQLAVPPAGASSSSAAGVSAGIPRTESPNSDLSGGPSSPSSPDGASGNAESLTSEERRARQNHNIVEKQYRNRLNSQFERLLSILPANQMEGAEMGRTVEFDERRMSKAEVLDLARRRIHALENEIQQLYTDRDNLRNNVATLNLAIQNGQQQKPQQQQQKMGITI